MKTEPMSQQIIALEKMDGRRWYALFMEQGTGKTWSLLADAARYWERGKIDGLFVLAPNGVQLNWVLREIPEHLAIPYRAHAWTSGARKSISAQRHAILGPHGHGPELRIMTMNYEALNGAGAREFALQFLQSGAIMFDLDESQKIKTPTSGVTKHVMGLKPHSVARRIATGTPMDKPQDIYQQFDFMESGLLGTSSYRAFVAEFAVLADHANPKTDSDWAMRRMVEKNPRIAWSQQIARDDITGLPMYRNLDRLQKLVEKHSYRVLKKDCLGLPDKVYQTIYFELTPKQRAAYELMENEYRIQMADGQMTPVSKLAAFGKLQQITSGYVIVPGIAEPMYVEEKNPRIQAVVDYIDENAASIKVIVWAKFREEVAALSKALRAAGRNVVEYHGDVSRSDRDAAIDSIQKGDADTFIGIQKAGGTGLTLTKAILTIYCSNEHSAIVRNQSEDRNHRKGSSLTEPVVYLDVAAVDTLDESITRAHQYKSDLAGTILGDRGLDLRGVL